MSEILEIVMLVCFGISWPINAFKSFKAHSTKGTSLLFLYLIFVGYIAGILSKFTNSDYMADFTKKWYVLFVYFVNLFSLMINLLIYYRNKAYEAKHPVK